MSLSIGIVGLPNVGKSTILNALTGAQHAAAENYPFCTVEPNHAVVPVPDSRVERIAELTDPEKVTHTTIEFVDIAGLVRDASKGEGLGNQFLANIGEVDAILHVVRCFEDGNVAHVEGGPDPVRDIQIVETELLLRDLQMVEARVEKLGKQVRHDKHLQPELDAGRLLLEHLNAGQPARLLPDRPGEGFQQLFTSVPVLTDKPVVYCANMDEDGWTADAPHVQAAAEYASSRQAPLIRIAARMEQELIEMDAAERGEFLQSYGIEEDALGRMIRAGYEALGLISFFTLQSRQVQAWTVRRGTAAPAAAGIIHTDFEKGFIRAEVIAFEDLVEQGSEAACKTAGVARTEGKDYEVRDGDIIRFLFNA